MSFAEAVRLIALDLVFNSQRKTPKELDPDYPVRRIFRWYSKAFHTPLHLVEELPLYDVLLAYWEEQFEALNERELEMEREAAIEDPEVLKERQRLEDEADFDVHLMAREELAAAKKNAVQSLEDAASMLRGLSKDGPLFGPKDKETNLIMTPVTKLTETPADIKLEFVDDLDLDADSFGLLDKPKKRR
jgi:hypothetical protein